jgi:hypothetical protein
MKMNFKSSLALGLSAVFGLLVALFAVGYWLNFPGVHSLLGQLHDALAQVLGALFVGLTLLFFVGLALGVAYAVVELHRRSRVTIIGHSKHGPQQAFIHNGEVHHLVTSAQQQLDPMQQLAMLKSVMQLQSQMSKLAQTSVREVAADETRQLAAPQEGIPAIVRYADVQDEVPDGMSLLGIHPANGDLELSDWEKLKMLWIVGSSSTGKSNTVFGKALEAVNHGARLLVVDQHAVKDDSLTRKLEPLKASFLRSVAVTDEQVLSTLAAFKSEFNARVDGASCSQKIVLIMDEINRMARNGALLAAIKEVVAIGGEESRGFGMYVWAISQKAVYLKWLRDSAITVIAHRVTRMEEAMLACNDDRKAAARLLKFPVGRSFIYGVDFDDLIELQQPLYDAPGVVESTVETPSALLPQSFQSQQWEAADESLEANGEATGSEGSEKDTITDLSTIKTLREIGKRLKKGDDKADIVKSFGLPYGRATQEIAAVVDMVAQEIEREG